MYESSPGNEISFTFLIFNNSKTAIDANKYVSTINGIPPTIVKKIRMAPNMIAVITLCFISVKLLQNVVGDFEKIQSPQ